LKSFYDIPDFENKIIVSTDFYHLIYDGYPVNKGHILIVSKEQKKDYFELSQEEKIDMHLAIALAKSIIEKEYSPDGYNVGMNCGEYAGQTIFHFHCHIIPRYKGDMENPRGGVRHCIPEKGNY
jgi:diadenosine tetraphosphate (Ap4A) HIT family hydrolase